MAPITLGIEVAELQDGQITGGDASHGGGDLLGDESATTTGGFVVEQDAVAGEHVIRLAVVLDGPEGVKLSYTVGGTRIERGGLLLGDFHDLTVQLGGGSLIESRVLFETTSTNGFEQAHRTQSGAFASVLGHLEGHLDMGLGGEVVDFVGAHAVDDRGKIGRIDHVAIMQFDLSEDVIDTRSVERGRPPDDAVHDVTLLEQKFGKITTILAGNTGDQRDQNE